MPASEHSVASGGCAAKSAGYVLAILIILGAFGCSSMRQQISRRCENCNSLCKQARSAKDDGYPDQADLLLNEALRQRPADLETRRQLADALWECGRRDEAISEYNELSQLHPRDVRLQQRLAVMSWTVGQHDDAARFADAALRLSPNAVEALLVKARTQLARSELDAAAATYIRLTAADPNLVEAKLELAEVHVQRDHGIQACSLLRDVMMQSRLDPAQQAETEWKLGLAYASANRWTEAANHLSHAAQQRETAGADWQILALARTRAGQETSGFPTMAVLASGQQQAKPERSAWTALRDQLLHPGQATDVAAQDDVVRADFTKSAQVDVPASTDSARR